LRQRVFAPGNAQRSCCERERQLRHDLVGGSVASFGIKT
jgi:hypothetical protein